MPESTAIPSSQKRDPSAAALQKVSVRWALHLCAFCHGIAISANALLGVRSVPVQEAGSAVCGWWYSGTGPSQPSSGAASYIYSYRRNLNLLFLLSSVFLSDLCFYL